MNKISASTSSPSQALGSSRSDATSAVKTANDNGKVAMTSTTSGPSASAPTNVSVMQRARSAIANAPDVDMDKVNQVKSSIRNGSFKIDASAIAKAYTAMESDSHQ